MPPRSVALEPPWGPGSRLIRGTGGMLRLRRGPVGEIARLARTLAWLDSPAAVPWPESDTRGTPHLLDYRGGSWILTSYHLGPSLEQALRRWGAPPPAQGLRLALRCAQLVGSIHERGGLAGQPDARAWLWSGGRPMLPDPGAPLPPRIQAPEVILGEPPGAAADVYALALLAGQILAGEGPEWPPLVLRLERAPCWPASSHLPPTVASVLTSCLDPDPQGRPLLVELLGQLAACALPPTRWSLRTPSGRCLHMEPGQVMLVGRQLPGGPRVDLDLSSEPKGMTVSRRHAWVVLRGSGILEVQACHPDSTRIQLDARPMVGGHGQLHPGEVLLLGAVELRLVPTQ